MNQNTPPTMNKKDIISFCYLTADINKLVSNTNTLYIPDDMHLRFESSFKKLFNQAYSEVSIENTNKNFKADIIKNTKELLEEQIDPFSIELDTMNQHKFWTIIKNLHYDSHKSIIDVKRNLLHICNKNEIIDFNKYIDIFFKALYSKNTNISINYIYYIIFCGEHTYNTNFEYSDILKSNYEDTKNLKEVNQVFKSISTIEWKYVSNPLTIISDHKDDLLFKLKDFAFESNFAPFHYYLLFILNLKEWCVLDLEFLAKWQNTYIDFYSQQNSNYHLANIELSQLLDMFIDNLLVYWDKKR